MSAIYDPDVGTKLWKPLRKRRVPRLIIWFSCKLRRLVHFESALESDLGIFAEADPSVIEYCENAVRADAVIEGKPHTSIIDLSVKLHDSRRFFCEVKYFAAVHGPGIKPETQRQIEVQREWAARNGEVHSVLTEYEIHRRKQYLANCKQLLTSLRASVHKSYPETAGKVAAILAKEKSLTFNQLCETASCSQSALLTSVAELLFSGKVAADLDSAPLTASTKFWTYYGNLCDHPNAFKYRA